MDFCQNCNNILYLKNVDGKIQYYCKKCSLTGKSVTYPIKTSIIDSRKITKYDRKKDIIDSGLFDNTYPISTEKCKTCGEYLIYYLNEKDMTNWYICRKCTKK